MDETDLERQAEQLDRAQRELDIDLDLRMSDDVLDIPQKNRNSKL